MKSSIGGRFVHAFTEDTSSEGSAVLRREMDFLGEVFKRPYSSLTASSYSSWNCWHNRDMSPLYPSTPRAGKFFSGTL